MHLRLRTFLFVPIIALVAGFSLTDAGTAADTAARKAVIEAEIPKITANIAANPGMAHLYFSRACMYRVLEKWDLAFQDYNSAIEKKLSEWQDQAYEGRGLCRMNLGLYKEALADFNFSLKLNSGLFNARKNRAILLYRMRYPQQSMTELTSLLNLKAHGADPSLLLLRARIRNGLRDYKGALADANACLVVDASNDEALQERAQIYVGMKQPQKAIAELTDLIGRSPQKGGLWGALALAYYGMGDYKQTVLNTNKAVELGYQNADMFAACADSYAKLGQHQHCITMATSAIGLNPSMGLAYYLRGNSWKHLQRADLSTTDLAKATDLGYK